MILPIYAYGMPVLRKKAEDITPEYEGLSTLLENMFETMYDSSGIGLAAPQIGLPIRLFIVDGTDIEEDPSTKDFKKIFINAQILEEFDTPGNTKRVVYRFPSFAPMLNAMPKLPSSTSMKTSCRKPKPTRAWPPASFNTNTTTSKAFCLPTAFTPSREIC